MSLVPSQGEAEHATVQKSELEPSRPVDPPNFFWGFIDALKRKVMPKTYNWADRIAEAKVREKEIENEVKLRIALASIEKTCAETRKIDAEARQEEIKADAMEMFRQQIEINLATPTEKLAMVLEIKEKIEELGGVIEFQLPSPPGKE